MLSISMLLLLFLGANIFNSTGWAFIAPKQWQKLMEKKKKMVNTRVNSFVLVQCSTGICIERKKYKERRNRGEFALGIPSIKQRTHVVKIGKNVHTNVNFLTGNVKTISKLSQMIQLIHFFF